MKATINGVTVEIDRLMKRLERRPITYPIVAIANILHSVFYQFPLWLMGDWLCDECHKRFGVEDRKVYMQWGDVCPDCAYKCK